MANHHFIPILLISVLTGHVTTKEQIEIAVYMSHSASTHPFLHLTISSALHRTLFPCSLLPPTISNLTTGDCSPTTTNVLDLQLKYGQHNSFFFVKYMVYLIKTRKTPMAYVYALKVKGQ